MFAPLVVRSWKCANRQRNLTLKLFQQYTHNYLLRSFSDDTTFYLNKHDPEDINEMLETVEERLANAEKEGYGSKYRGRGPIHQLLRAEAPSNRKRSKVNLQTATTELKALIYTRHALKHGGMKLKEFKPPQLAKTFLGPDTKFKMTIEDAKKILVELWRYGKSQRLVEWERKHAKEVEKLRKANEKRLARAEQKRLEEAADAAEKRERQQNEDVQP